MNAEGQRARLDDYECHGFLPPYPRCPICKFPMDWYVKRCSRKDCAPFDMDAVTDSRLRDYELFPSEQFYCRCASCNFPLTEEQTEGLPECGNWPCDCSAVVLCNRKDCMADVVRLCSHCNQKGCTLCIFQCTTCGVYECGCEPLKRVRLCVGTDCVNRCSVCQGTVRNYHFQLPYEDVDEENPEDRSLLFVDRLLCDRCVAKWSDNTDTEAQCMMACKECGGDEPGVCRARGCYESVCMHKPQATGYCAKHQSL